LTQLESANPGRYAVLDALRFVLALWVALGHSEVFPLFAGVDVATRFGRFVTHAWASVFFGNPAVIVFFVISGFCIHLPFRGDSKPGLGRYYLRRYTRILIPVAGAVCVYRLVQGRLLLLGEHSILWDSPLWSLACEEIYYAVYPLFRAIRYRVGWEVLLPATFMAGAGTAATHLHSTTWFDFGPLGTSVILLPVWLLGCMLAEQVDALPVVDSSFQIWMWRFAVWLGCWLVEILHFKVGIPYTQTLLWFGVLAYFWIRMELAYGRSSSPNRYLVSLGFWSYSLYLIHWEGPAIFKMLPIPNLGFLGNWFGVLAISLGLSYLFYLLVENPSHRLARRIKLKISHRVVVARKSGILLPVNVED
jgi:peptidoglycan/LPS O-acetylase OafA/YrhL